jgi:hypothetical protein
MEIASLISTIVVAGVLAALVGFILFVGYVPISIPVNSTAGIPENSPCLFVKLSYKFDVIFHQKMPINMTCAGFDKLLQAAN